MKLVALASSVSVVALFLVACGADDVPIPAPGSTAAAVSHEAPDCEDSAHMEKDGCYDADGNPQDDACCKATTSKSGAGSNCEDSAHMEKDGCYDADGNPQDDACCKGGSNCEDEDGATCVKNATACKAMGGKADGNDCNGSATGLSYCCAMK